jgi:hypothetical protein
LLCYALLCIALICFALRYFALVGFPSIGIGLLCFAVALLCFAVMLNLVFGTPSCTRSESIDKTSLPMFYHKA